MPWFLEMFQGEVSTTEHIDVCKELLLNHYLPQAKIPELFLPDITQVTKQLEEKMKLNPPMPSSNVQGGVLKIIQDPEYRRLQSNVNMDLALEKYNKPVESAKNDEERITSCVASFRRDLECLGQIEN